MIPSKHEYDLNMVYDSIYGNENEIGVTRLKPAPLPSLYLTSSTEHLCVKQALDDPN